MESSNDSDSSSSSWVIVDPNDSEINAAQENEDSLESLPPRETIQEICLESHQSENESESDGISVITDEGEEISSFLEECKMHSEQQAVEGVVPENLPEEETQEKKPEPKPRSIYNMLVAYVAVVAVAFLLGQIFKESSITTRNTKPTATEHSFFVMKNDSDKEESSRKEKGRSKVSYDYDEYQVENMDTDDGNADDYDSFVEDFKHDKFFEEFEIEPVEPAQPENEYGRKYKDFKNKKWGKHRNDKEEKKIKKSYEKFSNGENVIEITQSMNKIAKEYKKFNKDKGKHKENYAKNQKGKHDNGYEIKHKNKDWKKKHMDNQQKYILDEQNKRWKKQKNEMKLKSKGEFRDSTERKPTKWQYKGFDKDLKEQEQYLTQKEKYLIKKEYKLMKKERRIKLMRNSMKYKPSKFPDFVGGTFFRPINKSVSGEWYLNLHKGRNDIRQEAKESEWLFDRARMRSKKRKTH